MTAPEGSLEQKPDSQLVAVLARLTHVTLTENTQCTSDSCNRSLKKGTDAVQFAGTTKTFLFCHEGCFSNWYD